jgi:hypothetical protein
MNLLIAPSEITAVINIRRHCIHGFLSCMRAAHCSTERDHVRRRRIGTVEEP